MQNIEERIKPWTGKHWWYRQLTGRRFTFPYMNQQGFTVYWKEHIKTKKVVPCTTLNFIYWIARRYFNYT